jgi:mono/diheme cytochrome c family protein
MNAPFTTSAWLLCALGVMGSLPCMAAHAEVNGEQVFRGRCAVCHGANADGKSKLAKLMRPPPANLRASHLDDEQRALIVRKGGAAVGRSPDMPTWEHELKEDELHAVLAYVGSVKGTAP